VPVTETTVLRVAKAESSAACVHIVSVC